MSTRSCAAFVLAASAAIACGCSSRGEILGVATYEGTAQTTPLTRATFGVSDYPTAATLIFVSNQNNSVTIYDAAGRNQTPIATITDMISSPIGLALNPRGKLYVADDRGNEVVEFPKGRLQHSTFIKDFISLPRGMVVDRSSILYVGVYPGSHVVEFPPGSKVPSKVVGGQLGRPGGLALDSAQNVYVADIDAHKVFKIPHGTAITNDLRLQRVSDPVSVAVDAHDNLYVVDTQEQLVNVYAPDATVPTSEISIPGKPVWGAVDIATGNLYVANDDDNGGGAIEVFAPGQTRPFNTITSGIAGPTAVLVRKP